MNSKFKALCAGVTATAVMALPGIASADVNEAAKAVRAHTDKADAALDRAVSLYEKNASGRAERKLDRSRSQMSKARADARRAFRKADSGREERKAASAQKRLGKQYGENVDELVGLLDEVSGKDESPIAEAALEDTAGRDKALSILERLMGVVPDRATEGIARAMKALVVGRDEEVAAAAEALAGGDVSARNEDEVTEAISENVDGQSDAAATLAELIDSPDVPEEAKPGLRIAHAAVLGTLDVVSDVLSGLADRLPPELQATFNEVIGQIGGVLGGSAPVPDGASIPSGFGN